MLERSNKKPITVNMKNSACWYLNNSLFILMYQSYSVSLLLFELLESFWCCSIKWRSLSQKVAFLVMFIKTVSDSVAVSVADSVADSVEDSVAGSVEDFVFSFADTIVWSSEGTVDSTAEELELNSFFNSLVVSVDSTDRVVNSST